MAIKGLEEIQPPPFFFWMIHWDPWEPWPIRHKWVLTGESIRQEGSVRGSEVIFDCMRMQSCIVSATWSLCACLDCITFLIHTGWATTAPLYLKQYHGHIPSTAHIAWGAFISWQNGRFPLFPGRPSCLVQTWLNSFLPCAYFVSVLRRTLMHPQWKASSFGVVWVSKFPSFFFIAATQMFTLWHPSWSFTFESCQSLSYPLPNTKTFFLVDSYSQKMRERSVMLLICLLPRRLFPRLNVVQLSSHHSSVLI